MEVRGSGMEVGGVRDWTNMKIYAHAWAYKCKTSHCG